MPSSTFSRALSDPGRLLRLWLGVLAGPVAFLAVLETNYVLAYVACERRHVWMIHLASLAAIALVAAAGASAWRAAIPGSEIERPTLDPAQTSADRDRFLAWGAVALCAWFIVAIVALEIPPLVLRPCQ
jgi:hypothetical protein